MSQIPTTAKAWRFPPDNTTWNSFHSLELRDVLITPPTKGEVLVKLHAVSLNYRDILISNNQYGGDAATTGSDGGGLIPTSDAAGEIVALGEGVSGWKVGDRVHSLFSNWINGPLKPENVASLLGSMVQGCLTQFRVFPAELILPIPAHLSYEEAAAIPCAGLTAWNALFEKRGVTKDSSVLVLGSGGVSIFGAQLAKAAGARVIATTSSNDKADMYRALGVDHVINYRETPNWSEKVKELTGGEGVEQVIEIGGQGTLIQSLKSIKQEGIIHVIGFRAQVEPQQTLGDVAQLILLNQATVIGGVVGNKEMAQRMDSFLSKHQVKPALDPRVFAWTEVLEAYKYLESGSHFGKVVIRIE